MFDGFETYKFVILIVWRCVYFQFQFANFNNIHRISFQPSKLISIDLFKIMLGLSPCWQKKKRHDFFIGWLMFYFISFDFFLHIKKWIAICCYLLLPFLISILCIHLISEFFICKYMFRFLVWFKFISIMSKLQVCYNKILSICSLLEQHIIQSK